jgi:hypothetical protein
MNADLIFGSIKAAYDWLVSRTREEKERKRAFGSLLDELHNITERCNGDIATIHEEILKLHPTAPLFVSTLILLNTFGWESLRSREISTTLDADTLARLCAIYNQVDASNQLMTRRERYIASDIPTSVQPTYIKDCDEKLLKTLESIKTEIEAVGPEIKRRADC